MFVIQTASSVAAHTGYVPPPTVIPPMTTSDSITVSWPAPPGAAFLENYVVNYRLGQISRRRKRQTGPSNITVPASQTSYTIRDNIQPFENYTLQVFATFGNGVVSSVLDPFTIRTGEACMLTARLVYCDRLY